MQAELLEQALSERKALINLCLYAMDRARSSGVVERLEAGLAELGVSAVRPDGERFDPAHHEAGGTQPTEDPALDGLVAETELAGFTDRGLPLRPPIVIVYAS
ncbi:molecular chaperone GrpE (heat shock protein) [Kutzneria viridogrisea]|uniref:Molecular chaperone GrpE (Heat shock protein) n=1 Tax=Kutzneria viridogrisea TaxID=47990 RepID=A0ABR6BR49_9PSEU|nr:molecular chaperone GrpE (heat shock protein) [Kutzneria viridogrisea]